MNFIDAALDTSLIGYTSLGIAARRLAVHEPFRDIAGKHVLITGSTRGIGRAMVERLALNGAVVHAVGRNSTALSDLANATTGEVVPHTADLSLMESVVSLGSRLAASGQPLHGLVNNVSVMSSERALTSEGFELTYATNLLGQYLLTRCLLPALVAGAPSRIVMVSSGGMYSQALTATNIDSSRGEYSPTAAYARTKRGEVVLAGIWAKELSASKVQVNAMHPGWVDTDGVRDSLPGFHRIMRPLLRSPAQGADTAVWLVASDEAEDRSGLFFHDRTVRTEHRFQRTIASNDTVTAFLERLGRDAAPFLVESRNQKE